MANTKTILIVIAIICGSIGYYAWRQQKAALRGLEQARSQGAKIDFFLYSRPLFALDSTHKQLLLIDAQQTTSIKLADIEHIRFIETPTTSHDNTDPRGPDTISITLKDGQHYRVGDLRKSARNAIKKFRSFAPQVESTLKLRN